MHISKKTIKLCAWGFLISLIQLDINIMENIRLIQAQLDEIKQNNC
jgi:hypothetical protein